MDKLENCNFLAKKIFFYGYLKDCQIDLFITTIHCEI